LQYRRRQPRIHAGEGFQAPCDTTRNKSSRFSTGLPGLKPKMNNKNTPTSRGLKSGFPLLKAGAPTRYRYRFCVYIKS